MHGLENFSWRKYLTCACSLNLFIFNISGTIFLLEKEGCTRHSRQERVRGAYTDGVRGHFLSRNTIRTLLLDGVFDRKVQSLYHLSQIQHHSSISSTSIVFKLQSLSIIELESCIAVNLKALQEQAFHHNKRTSKNTFFKKQEVPTNPICTFGFPRIYSLALD